MKGIALIAAGITTLLAGGCASVPQSNAAYDSYDMQKITAINTVARSRGVLVQWINYPLRKSSESPVAPAVANPS